MDPTTCTEAEAAAVAVAGEAVFTFPGSYNWVVPDGVTCLSVVAVGGAGVSTLSGTGDSTGGGGGGLCYRSRIRVVPGSVVRVVVGSSGGDLVPLGGYAGYASHFNANLVAYGGSAVGCPGNCDGVSVGDPVDGGWVGGFGGTCFAGGTGGTPGFGGGTGGGGGAAGYAGNGGNGANGANGGRGAARAGARGFRGTEVPVVVVGFPGEVAVAEEAAEAMASVSTKADT